MAEVTYDPDDILRGAGKIAKFLGPGWNERKVYYAAEKKTLPIGRRGSVLEASKRKLAEEFDKSTSGEAA